MNGTARRSGTNKENGRAEGVGRREQDAGRHDIHEGERGNDYSSRLRINNRYVIRSGTVQRAQARREKEEDFAKVNGGRGAERVRVRRARVSNSPTKLVDSLRSLVYRISESRCRLRHAALSVFRARCARVSLRGALCRREYSVSSCTARVSVNNVFPRLPFRSRPLSERNRSGLTIVSRVRRAAIRCALAYTR